MVYKFKYLEKVIGSFILLAILILISTIIFVVRGRYIFAKKVYFNTYFNKGEGLMPGLPVIFNGIRIGAVTKVELNRQNKIDVTFYVLNKYADRVRTDSVAKFNIPFLGIGSKTLEITEGSQNAGILKNGDTIISADSDEGKMIVAARKEKDLLDDVNVVIKNLQEFTAMLKDLHEPLYNTMLNIQTISKTFAENKENIHNLIDTLNHVGEDLIEISRALKEHPFISAGKKSKPVSQRVEYSERYEQYR